MRIISICALASAEYDGQWQAEHAIKLEECCQNHASLENEWQDKVRCS